MAELDAPDLPGLLRLEVPHPDPPRLVAQGKQPGAGVQAEPHKPDVTVPEVELVDHHALVLAQPVYHLGLPVKAAGLPAHDLVLAAL